MIDLDLAPIGTPHATSTCCWCGAALVVGQVLNLRCWLCPIDWRRQANVAVTSQFKGKAPQCFHVPLPSQTAIEESTARNLLWGGHAGPGKSVGIRHWLYRRSMRVPGHEALLLRENWDQLDKTHLRQMEREVPLLGGKFWKSDRKVSFGAGSDESIIDCGHMAEADAMSRYMGTDYGAIVPDEASLYPLNDDGVPMLAELSTRARKAYKDRQGLRVEPRFIPVTNPGGPSAFWLLDMFIDHRPDCEKFPALQPVFNAAGEQTKGYRPEQWAFIPAKLQDNPYMRDDYRDTDLAVLSGTRYRQLADGDWRVFAGQFFSEWQETKDGQPWHVRELAA
jgi:hypothetical protein